MKITHSEGGMPMKVYAGDNKKMLNMLILEILKDYTDADHRLTQQEIIDLLKLNYGAECDRRSIRNNIRSLKDMGYEIATERGCYLAEREFDDAELRMLIDSVLFSKNLSSVQAKRLIEKLRGFGNRYFHAKVAHVCNLPEFFHSDNKQVMLALDALNDAIEEKRKVSFIYNRYGTDFKLRPRRDEPYIVNPYQMVANNGRYYLIGNYDKYDDLKKGKDDNPTIGIILCAEKNETIARYSILKESQQIFASKYRTTMPTQEELEKYLQKERRRIEERGI